MFLKDSIQRGEVLARYNVSVRQRCLVSSARHRIERSDCIPIQLARIISNVGGARVILMRRSTFSLYASHDLRFNTGVESSLFQIISVYEVLRNARKVIMVIRGTELRFS